MLLVATPPNAVAYGSGYVTIGEMIKGGFWLNVIGIGVVTLASSTLLEWGFFAWIGGCLISMLFWDTELLVGPFAELSRSVGDLGFLAGILGAGVLYMLMYKLPVPTGLLRTRKAARQQAEAEAAAEADSAAETKPAVETTPADETKPATELEG